ncbi:MAG: DUF3429 domain-containing protein [Pseudomonadales bacterium]
MNSGAAPSPADSDPWLKRYAQGLGFLGWMPLAALLVLALLSPERTGQLLRVALIYAGTILAFLGGVQWGLALTSPSPRIRLRRLVAGMAPSLWAVTALVLPMTLCIVVLICGFAVVLAYETLERHDRIYPGWYLPLRTRLTTLMVLSLAAWLLLLP